MNENSLHHFWGKLLFLTLIQAIFSAYYFYRMYALQEKVFYIATARNDYITLIWDLETVIKKKTNFSE